jgi:hypothetical protein
MGIDFQRGETRLYLGTYEAHLNRHLRAIAKPGVRSFDIGGQYGYDALILARLTGAEVLSVESEPDLAVESRQNAEANPALPAITVEAAFVSDQDGDGEVTIDTLAERHFVPGLIKLDIEGGEVAALRGAKAVLTEHHPAIQLEVHGKDIEWECLELLRAAGYPPPDVVVNQRKWLPEHRPIDHNRWLFFNGF